jgi:hypothetical protein
LRGEFGGAAAYSRGDTRHNDGFSEKQHQYPPSFMAHRACGPWREIRQASEKNDQILSDRAVSSCCAWPSPPAFGSHHIDSAGKKYVIIYGSYVNYFGQTS